VRSITGHETRTIGLGTGALSARCRQQSRQSVVSFDPGCRQDVVSVSSNVVSFAAPANVQLIEIKYKPRKDNITINFLDFKNSIFIATRFILIYPRKTTLFQ
jgi:hypothetical protein